MKVLILFFLGRYVIQNVAAQKDGEKSKVKVKVRVNTHGIFSVSTASMVEPVKSEENEDVSVETEVESQDQRPTEISSDVSWPVLCVSVLTDESVFCSYISGRKIPPSKEVKLG